MVPASYATYFLGSTGASAALIGLLFVAIAVAPERIFGRQGTVERRARATSAFTALLDAFFVSLVALIPKTNLGYTAFVMGVIGLLNTLSVSRHFWEERVPWHSARPVILLAGSLVVYVWELWFAVSLLGQPRGANAIEGLAYLLLGAYALGVARAWELLGAEPEGLFTFFSLRHERIQSEAAGDTEGEGQ